MDSITSVHDEITNFRYTNSRKYRNSRQILTTHGIHNINQKKIKSILRYINILKYQQMDFGFVDVNVLHSGHQHVSFNHAAIFKFVRTRIQIWFKCVYLTPQLKNHMVFRLKFTVEKWNKMTITIMYQKLKFFVWSMVLLRLRPSKAQFRLGRALCCW